MKKVITGHNADGKAIFVKEEPEEVTIGSPIVRQEITRSLFGYSPGLSGKKSVHVSSVGFQTRRPERII